MILLANSPEKNKNFHFIGFSRLLSSFVLILTQTLTGWAIEKILTFLFPIRQQNHSFRGGLATKLGRFIVGNYLSFFRRQHIHRVGESHCQILFSFFVGALLGFEGGDRFVSFGPDFEEFGLKVG
jgi:hypothetical protein